MCGRFTLTLPAEKLCALFQVSPPPGLGPRYNIAPTQPAPVVRPAGDEREMVLLRWGLVPPWARDPSLGSRLVNARAETAWEKPSFAPAFRRRRCLVPADGFYEWRKTPGGSRPYLFRFRDGRPFAFAGLWERWERGEEPLETFTILTTRANALVAPIHPRMPVILDPRDYDAWLDPSLQDLSRLAGLLQPFPPGGMEGFPVTPRVNKPGFDEPACVEPLPDPPGLW